MRDFLSPMPGPLTSEQFLEASRFAHISDDTYTAQEVLDITNVRDDRLVNFVLLALGLFFIMPTHSNDFTWIISYCSQVVFYTFAGRCCYDSWRY